MLAFSDYLAVLNEHYKRRFCIIRCVGNRNIVGTKRCFIRMIFASIHCELGKPMVVFVNGIAYVTTFYSIAVKVWADVLPHLLLFCSLFMSHLAECLWVLNNYVSSFLCGHFILARVKSFDLTLLTTKLKVILTILVSIEVVFGVWIIGWADKRSTFPFDYIIWKSLLIC